MYTAVQSQLVVTTYFSTNVGLTLAHRLRRWTNIKPTVVQRLVFALHG